MRASVYLLAGAALALIPATTIASEYTMTDGMVTVYESYDIGAAQNFTYEDQAVAYDDTYLATSEIVFVDDTASDDGLYTTEEIAFVSDFAGDDTLVYATDSVEEVYTIDAITYDAEETAPVIETIDGIVYETVPAPVFTY